MIIAVDVHYAEHAVTTACAGVLRWEDATTAYERVHHSEEAPAPYEPGQFYKRELPHVLRAIAEVPRPMATIIVDGHVWLKHDEPGLGAHLFTALREQIPIVGVAKKKYRDGVALPVLRGQSVQPLFVTAVGIDVTRTAELVRVMHGPHRLPTLLKRTDQLARGTGG